ncbi:MAG: NADP-dependent malic enzyme [Sphingomonadaceae bacterium]|uniref:NADP-dependent malic enzyme n=1 Tax=Thermaurantiacus sp. TaxID=2820283 RepID=UPI00298F30E8|nr:NADP-dependent malic enzyme [Thermaurantiacus sp.]MCS6987230.1 NADP-dependent malic enzyme [Sphingomonadaceae bacterium]MDW8414450.1 NADP-dependent malic enzyme [Thermaurantiacus sp.]
MAKSDRPIFSDREALLFHAAGRPGKLEVVPTKPVATQRDLSLAYSPGVAVPVRAIAEQPEAAYDYTAKGNLVAVISNGTAILGLGNLGALAAKPVMEGKAVLFKRFADIDSIDLEIATDDVERFIAAVELLEPSFGGINLEDIRAPECFVIESELRARMNIPVFHDDQHGTAIIAAAGLINALDLTGRRLRDIRLVVNGAGAAAIACAELVKAMGVPADQVILCDSKGVVFQGRTEGMNQWKAAHAVDTPLRTLEEAMRGADVFFGLSVKDAVSPDMVRSMAAKPILFAMANPDPEIRPEVVKAIRPDAIIATGRSDYPNQVNNVLGFPYIFRGALDVRASKINEEMKIAAARALAALAREAVPDEVATAYGASHVFGPDYIIPAPFDPRLIEAVPAAVAQAAIASGVARRPVPDMEAYRLRLRARMNPTSSVLAATFEAARARRRRVVFAEGEQEVVLRAAVSFRASGYGEPVLVGREDPILEGFRRIGVNDGETYTIHNSANSPLVPRMVEHLYARLQRQGYLRRDCQRMVNHERNVFGTLLLELGEADCFLSGLTRHFNQVFSQVKLVVDPRPGHTPFGIHIFAGRTTTILIADTTVNERPTAAMLADIAVTSAEAARRLGLEPRVAFISFSNFGNPPGEHLEAVRGAVRLLDEQSPPFEYEGEMSADVALNPRMREVYPFNRLTGPANVLVMPGLQSANIAAKLLKELGGGQVLGPVLMNMGRPVQIAPMTAGATEIVTLAALAAAGIMG